MEKQVNIHDLRFTSRVSQDLDKYKSKTCQTVILAKEQHAQMEISYFGI